MRLPRLAATGLLLALLAACRTEEVEFTPSSRIEKLRILGIKASPAAVLAGDRTFLESLVVNPLAGIQPLSYLWVICDPDPTGSGASFCGARDTTRDLSSLFADGGELPPGVTVVPIGESVYYRSPRGAFDQISADSPLRTQGLEATVLLVAYTGLTPTDLQDESVVREIALKRIRIFPKGVEKNKNPEIAEVLVNGEPFGEGEAPAFAPGTVLELSARATPSSLESYARPLPDGTELQEDETMVFSWYGTAGNFDQLQKQGARTEDGAPMRFTVPAFDDTPGGAIDLFVVLRDTRGGIDWARRTLKVAR
jgi:hypothetical protein